MTQKLVCAVEAQRTEHELPPRTLLDYLLEVGCTELIPVLHQFVPKVQDLPLDTQRTEEGHASPEVAQPGADT